MLNTILEQTRINKSNIETAKKEIMGTVASMKSEFVTAIKLTNERMNECENKIENIEHQVTKQNTTINEMVNAHTEKIEQVKPQIKHIETIENVTEKDKLNLLNKHRKNTAEKNV